MKITLSFLSICGIAIIGICAFSSLPMDSSGIVKEKYNDWSGVIRIWVCDDIKTDPAVWLNSCAADFEKTHSGIYINTRRVSSSAIAGFRDSGINPPDMIIWPAGLLESEDGLCEISGEYPLRSGLSESPYAIPLLTDAYAWIYNPSILSALPADMHDTPAACGEDMLVAMAALSTGKRSGETAEAVIPGVDLGLSGEMKAAEVPEGDVICRASSMLTITESAPGMLKSGDVPVITGDISQIVSLCGAGYAAQITGDCAYTGAPVMCSIVERDVSAADERRALCEDFLTYLLGPGQEKAALAGAMPAAEGVTAHAGDPVLSYIEAQLAGLECISPPCFGGARINEGIYRFIDGNITADEALGR